MRICFLIHYQTSPARAANVLYLANAALSLKHQVSLAFSDNLAYRHDDVHAKTSNITLPLSEDISLEDLQFVDQKLSGFDMVWLLNFGRRDTFLDKMQMLMLLSTRTRVINSPEALFFLHSKISMPGVGELMQYPQTHISSNAEELWDIVNDGKAEWVIKPTAESFGRKVFKLTSGDTNIKPLLQAMTGEDGSQYCLLQRYLPEVANGEKRILLAGGEVVGQYFRKSIATDHRGNLHQGGKASLCDLTSQERAASKRVAAYLLERGVYFAGLDMSWPWLIEWNVVSPGGVATIDKLGGGNLAKTIVQKVLAAAGQRTPEIPKTKRCEKAGA